MGWPLCLIRGFPEEIRIPGKLKRWFQPVFVFERHLLDRPSRSDRQLPWHR